MLLPWTPLVCQENNPLPSWPSSPPRTASCRGAGVPWPSLSQWTSPALKTANRKVIPTCCGCCSATAATELQSERCRMIFYCFIWYQPLWKTGQRSEHICAVPASQTKWKSGHFKRTVQRSKEIFSKRQRGPRCEGDVEVYLRACAHSHDKQQHILKDETCPECLKHWLSYCFSAGKALFCYHSSYLSLPDTHQHSEFS